MILNEIYERSPEAYQDLSQDNSQPTLKDTRKTRLTLRQLNKLRQMNDVRTYEYKEKLKLVCDILEEEKVEYRLGTAGGGNQALQPYLKNYNHRVEGDLSNINYIHHYALYIGNHPELTSNQIIDLCSKLNKI